MKKTADAGVCQGRKCMETTKARASASAQIYAALFPVLAGTAVFLLEMSSRTLQRGGSGLLILVPLVAFAAELAVLVVFNCRIPAKWGAAIGLILSGCLFALVLMADLWPQFLSVLPESAVNLMASSAQTMLFVFCACFFFELFILCLKTPLVPVEETRQERAARRERERQKASELASADAEPVQEVPAPHEEEPQA